MKKPASFEYLVIAGGRAPSSVYLKRLAARCRHVVTVDKGAVAAYRAGLRPDFHVGDDDSVSSVILKRLIRDLPEEKRRRLPARKSVSDLEYALSILPRATLKIVTGAHRDDEGRADHVFVNFMLALRDARVFLVDEKMWIRGLGRGAFSFVASRRTTFSVVSPRRQKVTIAGSAYDVKNKIFSIPSLGLSNQVKGGRVTIRTRGPALLFVAGDFLASHPRRSPSPG